MKRKETRNNYFLEIINKPIFKSVSILIICLLFWLFASIFLNPKVSFSVLRFSDNNAIKTYPSEKLLKNYKITGQFSATQNYMGLISIKFNHYVKPDYRGEDVLSFKIKEKGQSEWYYYNNYRSGLVENELLFPFGFPIVESSQNKTYQFEIQSLFGNETNAVELNKSKSNFYVSYQVPKKIITGSKTSLVKFMVLKIENLFFNPDILLGSLIYMIPLIFYLCWVLLIKKLSLTNQLFSFISLIFIFVDIFFIQEFYFGVFLLGILAWITSIKIYKLEGSVSFILGFILILIWLFLSTIKQNQFSEKINIWSYFFLFSGVTQAIIEVKFEKSKINYKTFLKGLFKLK